MALKNPLKWFSLGAIASVVTVPLLTGISKIASAIPGVSVDLQSISIQTTGIGEVINPGLSVYAQKVLSIIPVQMTGMEWILTAIGGGAFVLAGAYVYDMLKFKAKSKVIDLGNVFALGSLVTTMILSAMVSIPAIPLLITLLIDSYLLAWILVTVERLLKTKFIPN